ncbi:MAG: lipopolysaccharide biosynthesis protein [Syntrophorhabdaceae bacterium]
MCKAFSFSNRVLLNNQTIQLARIHRLLKEGFWIVLGHALAVLGALFGVRLLTELLNPSAYGELALGMTIATFVDQTVLGPLSNGVMRFYAPAMEQGNIEGYWHSVRRLVLSATWIIVLMLFVMVAGLLITGRLEWIAIAITAFIFAIFTGFNSILSGIQLAARKRSVVAFHQALESWGRFLVAAAFILVLGATSTIAMVGYATASILVLGSQYTFFRKTTSQRTTEPAKVKDWSKQVWMYSWPFASWGIFYWAQSASDRWALELFRTPQEVGCYAVLFQLGFYPISIATGMAMQFVAPILYQRAGDASDGSRNADARKLCWRLTSVALGVTATAFGVTFLFHAQIFQIFVAKEYAIVSYLLPWMLLSGGFFAVGQTFALNLMSQMKTRTMLVIKIVTASFGALMNIVGAYYFGIAGLVFAGILFSIVYSLWMAIQLRRTMPLPLRGIVHLI